MFGSLARRLTAWYVVVATLLVLLLAGSVMLAALFLYARETNEQIEAVGRQIPDIEARARADRDDWVAGSHLLLRRAARPGISIQALPRPPDYNAVRPPERRVAGDPPPPPVRAFYNDRLGFLAATFLGIRPVRRPFLGGLSIVFADLARVRTIVGVSIAILSLTGGLAGLVAWAIGRYITMQALRPLYDVTSALVRFAGRDFSAAPITLAGRSEFDQLARAYNAAAAQVEAAFDERAAAEAQMRQFVADAGHELRTPLTIVLGYIDMLKRRAPADERSRRIFATIAIEGSRMRTLIDNLVLLARLEGEDPRPAEPFELTALLENDIVGTRREIATQRINVAIGVDATIVGNRSDLYEAIANIVDNARKYAPGSAVDIGVQARGPAVEITIADDGPGIAPAERDAIFARFYRGSQRGEVEGSGLGLAIAKRAVERAGGSLVLADSPSGSGTTFIIRLRAERLVTRHASREAFGLRSTTS